MKQVGLFLIGFGIGYAIERGLSALRVPPVYALAFFGLLVLLALMAAQ